MEDSETTLKTEESSENETPSLAELLARTLSPDRMAARLSYEAGKSLRGACRRLTPPLEIELAPLAEIWPAKAGFRLVQGGPAGFSSPQLPFVVRPLISLAPGHPFPMRIEATPYGVHLDAGVDEVYPEASLDLLHRLGIWAETLTAALKVESLR